MNPLRAAFPRRAVRGIESERPHVTFHPNELANSSSSCGGRRLPLSARHAASSKLPERALLPPLTGRLPVYRVGENCPGRRQRLRRRCRGGKAAWSARPRVAAASPLSGRPFAMECESPDFPCAGRSVGVSECLRHLPSLLLFTRPERPSSSLTRHGVHYRRRSSLGTVLQPLRNDASDDVRTSSGSTGLDSRYLAVRRQRRRLPKTHQACSSCVSAREQRARRCSHSFGSRGACRRCKKLKARI